MSDEISFDEAMLVGMKGILSRKNEEEIVEEYEKGEMNSGVRTVAKTLVEDARVCPVCYNDVFYDSEESDYYCELGHLEDGT